MCDTIGKIFSNGTALFGKNSDRSPNEPQTLYYYPSMTYPKKSFMTTYLQVESAEKTKAILISRPSWLWGGEMGVNTDKTAVSCSSSEKSSENIASTAV